MEKQLNQPNNKSWSWTEKQHRRSYRSGFWNGKPKGIVHCWNKSQREYNKRQLEKLIDGLYYNGWVSYTNGISCRTIGLENDDVVHFLNNHRHTGLWDLW